MGSPPRMRERLRDYLKKHLRFGITPAYAGKTPFLKPKLTGTQDHPRVCGKDYYWHVHVVYCLGSPPRMRERLFNACPGTSNIGITPAYAGKTCFCLVCGLGDWDHPRVCGKDCCLFVVWKTL